MYQKIGRLSEVNRMSLETSKNTARIISAALSLFKKQGYANVTVSHICKESGVPRSSFYNIFSSKDEIIASTLTSARSKLESSIGSFIVADNDFERIWFLYSIFLDIVLEYGPDLSGTLLKLELEHSIGILDTFNTFQSWFEKLMKNCQDSGIIQNLTDPAVLVQLSFKISIGLSYEWCASGGAFSLLDQARKYSEDLLNVKPEARWPKS